MNGKERLAAALNHKIPDRVPFDLGGTPVSGIHVDAYKSLVQALGYKNLDIEVRDTIQQLAEPHEEILKELNVDVRGIFPQQPDRYIHKVIEDNDYSWYIDEWGVTWQKPIDGGFYYDMKNHPLADRDFDYATEEYIWVNPLDDGRYQDLEEKAALHAGNGYAVILGSICAGVSEMHAWLRGYNNYYTDFYLYPEYAAYLMDKIVDIKIAYWERTLKTVGKYSDVVVEADDMAGQTNLLISPDTYREYIKPRHVRLFGAIKELAPHVKIFFHSCGAIRDLIPDLIDCGIDILNPVQKAAKGMDLVELKRTFGQEITFWGGGVDTQKVFDGKDQTAIIEDVTANIQALKSGGGFVFTPIHNTQPNIPGENYLTMWKTLQKEGVY